MARQFVKAIRLKKKCRKCNQRKPIQEFNFNKATIDGHSSYCKKCVRKIAKAKYENEKEKRIEEIAAWKAKNPEKTIKYTEDHKKRLKLKRDLDKLVKNL